jgi:hypothetical protein
MPDPSGRLKAALADRYDIEREVGAGGMATVYLARAGWIRDCALLVPGSETETAVRDVVAWRAGGARWGRGVDRSEVAAGDRVAGSENGRSADLEQPSIRTLEGA